MASPTRPLAIWRLLRLFKRSGRGSAAVEFALVAPLFFGLLFAVIESALMFFAGQVLETVTQNSARMILTGQAQSGGYSAAQFKTYVCSQIPALFDCSQIYVDVQKYSQFSAVTIISHIDAAGNFDANMAYDPGQASDTVVVRVFYQWPLFVTGLGYNVSNLANNKRLLVATAAFKNEPY